MEVRHAQGSVSKWQTVKEKAKEVFKEGIGKTIAGKLKASKESQRSTGAGEKMTCTCIHLFLRRRR